MVDLYSMKTLSMPREGLKMFFYKKKRAEIRQSTALLSSPFTTINYTSPMIPVGSPSLEASNTTGSLFLHSGHHQMYCLDGNRTINFKKSKIIYNKN